MAEKTADLQRYARFVAALKQEGVVKGLASCDSVDLCVSVTDVFAGLRREDQSRVAALLYARHRQGLLEASPGAAVRFYAAATGQEVARYGGGRLEWRSNPSDPAPPQ